jgi:hypothetical protein
VGFLNKKSNARGLTLPAFKLQWHSHPNKNSTILAQNRQDQWNRKEDPDMNPCSYSHLCFDKGAKTCIGEKIVSSTNGAGKAGYLPVQD